MKKLRGNEKSCERRIRSAREASLFQNMQIDGIPRLLDSNIVGIGNASK